MNKTANWRRFPLLLPGIIFLALSGCGPVGPDYTPPVPQAPSQWSSELSGGLKAETPVPEALTRWWTTLGDPKLESLMERAIKGNLDLKEARARVREARALRGISDAPLYPTLDVNAAASKQRIIGTKGIGTNSTGTEYDLFSAGFDAGWELDVFGGTRRAVEAAQADLEASQEDLRDVLVSLLAEVGRNYLEVRTYQRRLAVAADSIAAQEKNSELDKSRFHAGIIDELAVQQAQYNLEQTRSQVPVLQTGLAAAKHRLAVLLGLPPGELDKELAKPQPIPVAPATVAVGVPAEALRQRPDIRRAERQVAAATARIGVATADLYPKFRLTGSIGLESIKAEDLFNWDSRTWGIGPGVSWKIFDAGAVRRNIEVQSARQEQALAFYDKAVLSAQEEVENALVAYAKEQRRRESLQAAAKAAEKALGLAQDKYKAGLIDYSSVLDAQRALYNFQDAIAVSDGTVTENLVRLYKALGGGWNPADSTQIKGG